MISVTRATEKKDFEKDGYGTWISVTRATEKDLNPS